MAATDELAEFEPVLDHLEEQELLLAGVKVDGRHLHGEGVGRFLEAGRQRLSDLVENVRETFRIVQMRRAGLDDARDISREPREDRQPANKQVELADFAIGHGSVGDRGRRHDPDQRLVDGQPVSHRRCSLFVVAGDDVGRPAPGHKRGMSLILAPRSSD